MGIGVVGRSRRSGSGVVGQGGERLEGRDRIDGGESGCGIGGEGGCIAEVRSSHGCRLDPRTDRRNHVAQSGEHLSSGRCRSGVGIGRGRGIRSRREGRAAFEGPTGRVERRSARDTRKSVGRVELGRLGDWTGEDGRAKCERKDGGNTEEHAETAVGGISFLRGRSSCPRFRSTYSFPCMLIRGKGAQCAHETEGGKEKARKTTLPLAPVRALAA